LIARNTYSASRRGIPSAAFLRLGKQQPKLGAPVHERQAKPLQIRMPGPDQPLDFRNLPAAALDSSCLLPTLLRDLIERAYVAVKGGRHSRVFLEPSADAVGISRIEFHEPSLPAAALARDQR
jgi:hypothetical protein